MPSYEFGEQLAPLPEVPVITENHVSVATEFNPEPQGHSYDISFESPLQMTGGLALVTLFSIAVYKISNKDK